MRLIDADGSELQTQLKIIREAEYQIYGSGSWGFTAKCEHAIEDAPTVQPEPHWISVTERLPKEDGSYLVSGKWGSGKESVGDCEFSVEDGYFQTAWNFDVLAWMPLPEPFKGVTE